MIGKKAPEKLTEREKVAQRREEVLSRGRKFKYPLQYAKHRIAIITSIISVVAVATLITLGYAALYIFGSTGNIIYRVTEVLPVPVAEVAGESVRFSDYLLLYRSSYAVIEPSTSEDIEATRLEYKRSALTSAEQYAYAEKLARENNIEVSDEEVAELFEEHRSAGGTDRSEASFLKILQDNFGIDKSEYNRMLYLLLLKTKVSAAIDTNANTLADEISATLTANGGAFAETAEAFGEQVTYEDTGGLLGLDNIDGGRAAAAAKLNKGQWSGKILASSGDAYYFVKLIDKTEDGRQVNYVSIKIPFTEFDKRFSELGDEIKEFITIEDTETEQNS